MFCHHCCDTRRTIAIIYKFCWKCWYISNSVYLELLGDHVILVIYINGLYWSLTGFSVVDPTVGGYGIYRGESKTSATHVSKRPQHRHKLPAAGFLANRPIHRSSEVKTLTKEECLTIPESMHNFVTSRNTFLQLQLHVHMYLHLAARTGKIHKGGNQSLSPKMIYCFFKYYALQTSFCFEIISDVLNCLALQYMYL